MPGHRYPVDSFWEVGIPTAGMDTDTVPRLLPPSKAPLLKNFLMDRPGILPMRGPISEGLTWNLGASIGLCSVWSFGDKLFVSRFAASATSIRDYWVEPYRPTTSGPALRNAGLAYTIDLSSGTVASGGSGGGGRGVQAYTFVYGSEPPTSSATAQDGNQYSLRKLMRWNPLAGTTTSYVLGPTHIQDVAFHYNRIFVLGGRDATGAGRIRWNVLYWSDQHPTDGTALPDLTASWQDDVSGLINQIVIGSETPNDFGVSLAHVGANLCILKRHSLWMLYGTSPSNFSVKQVSNEVGCIDPRSVVEYNGGVYFMSERGFMFYDGVRAQSVSQGLTSTLAANALKQVGPQGVDGGYCRATLLDRGYILVTTGVVDGATLTTTADTDAWLLYAPTGAWTQLSSAALTSILAGGRTTNNTYLMTDQKLVKANYLCNPSATTGRGVDSLDGGVTKFTIPSQWTTRSLSLATPVRKSKLQRLSLEYYWSLATGGWLTSAVSRSLSLGITTDTSMMAAPTSISVVWPARGAADIYKETDELYIDITANDAGFPGFFTFAEIHRLLVESIGTSPIPGSM